MLGYVGKAGTEGSITSPLRTKGNIKRKQILLIRSNVIEKCFQRYHRLAPRLLRRGQRRNERPEADVQAEESDRRGHPEKPQDFAPRIPGEPVRAVQDQGDSLWHVLNTIRHGLYLKKYTPNSIAHIGQHPDCTQGGLSSRMSFIYM